MNNVVALSRPGSVSAEERWLCALERMSEGSLQQFMAERRLISRPITFRNKDNGTGWKLLTVHISGQLIVISWLEGDSFQRRGEQLFLDGKDGKVSTVSLFQLPLIDYQSPDGVEKIAGLFNCFWDGMMALA